MFFSSCPIFPVQIVSLCHVFMTYGVIDFPIVYQLGCILFGEPTPGIGVRKKATRFFLELESPFSQISTDFKKYACLSNSMDDD